MVGAEVNIGARCHACFGIQLLLFSLLYSILSTCGRQKSHSRVAEVDENTTRQEGGRSGSSSTRNKPSLASDISNALSIPDQTVQQLEADLKTSASQQFDPFHHHHYRKHFNGVDLQDRYFYALQHRSNTLRNWRAKFIVSLLEMGIVNAFSLHSEFTSLTFKQFRTSLSSSLLSFVPDLLFFYFSIRCCHPLQLLSQSHPISQKCFV